MLKFPESPTRYSFGAGNLIDRGAIGSGNFGTVHKMEHNVTGRMMAVKVQLTYLFSIESLAYPVP